MIIGLGGYNPLDIRRRMRKQQERSSARLKLLKAGDEKKAKEERPEGPTSYLWDAYKFLYQLEQEWAQFPEILKRMSELCEKALNLTLADTERSSLHRLFVGAVRNFDYAAKHATVLEQTIFNGQFKDASFTMPLDEKGEKSLSIFIPSYTAEDMRLHLIKIDSMVNARKAEKKIAEIKKSLKEFDDLIVTKQNFVDLMGKTLGMERPNFESFGNDSENVGEESEDEVDVSELESRAPEFIILKRKMDRAAAAKGRDHSLLVNFKV